MMDFCKNCSRQTTCQSLFVNIVTRIRDAYPQVPGKRFDDIVAEELTQALLAAVLMPPGAEDAIAELAEHVGERLIQRLNQELS